MGITKMSFYLRMVMMVLLLSVSFSIIAQDDLLLKTLNKANEMRNTSDLEQAVETLEIYNNQYPGNIWVQRLLSETLFWLNDYEEAIFIYEEALEMHPDNFDVKYEYAIMLFGIGQYKKAQELLIIYTVKYPEVAEAEILLGTTYYYLGDFFPAAEHLERSLEINPANKRAAQLLKDVHLIIKPWINVSFAYNHDSQNINRLSPAIEGGMYKSAFLSPSFSVYPQYVNVDSIYLNQINILVRNSFLFNFGLKMNLGVGVSYISNLKSADLLWDILLQQKITNSLNFSVQTRRSAYTYTVASVKKPIFSNKYNISLEWKKQKIAWAKAGYLADVFPDANNVQTLFVWALSPAIKFSFAELRLGYSFNYSNSKESRFVTVKSKDDIINGWQEDEKIEGVYDPYFTPDNQFGNSVLGIIILRPSPKIKLKLNAAVGFYSKTMNPYFYLGNNNAGETVIKKDFYQESFTPLDLGINMNFDLSNNFYLNVSYKYLQTFYFNSNNIQLGLRVYFNNTAKKR